MSSLTDEASICLPLRKFGPNEHGLYLGYVLSNGPTDYAYKENIEKVKVYFWSKKSLLNNWFQCLTVRVRKKHQHLGCINEVASRFTFGSLNEEQLRCLFLILGLGPAKYAVIRPRLFTLLDKNSEMQRGCRTWNRSSPNVENSCLTVSVKLGQIRQIQK